jgi:hypothetical protein
MLRRNGTDTHTPAPGASPGNAADRRRRLDFGWWASKRPTAGYLVRLALEAIARVTHPAGTVRRADLHVLRLAAAAPFDVALSAQPGAFGLHLWTLTFDQGGPFAVASVLAAPDYGPASPGDASPPSALPLEAYPPMRTPAATMPPVTSRFVYRPTTELDGSGPRAGWDVVWATPTDPQLGGQALVASLIDCWYPPNHMRAVRAHLGAGQPLIEPQGTSLVATSVAFTAPSSAYHDLRHALLANQIASVSDGYYFERSEVWSEHGQLLATAELLRRNQHPTSTASFSPAHEPRP